MEVNILLHGEIGYEVTASNINAQIDEAIVNGVKKITFDIETFGGDVFIGRSILGRIDKAKAAGIIIETNVFSYAYSMGAVIFESATAGYRKIGEFGEIMLHAALSGVMGNADEMRKQAEYLDEVTENLKVVIFRDENAKANEAEILELMGKESMINSKDAVRLGLADGFIEKAKAVAQFKIKNTFMNILERIENMLKGIKNEVTNEVTSTQEGNLYHDGAAAIGLAVFTDEAMSVPAPDGMYNTDENVIEVTEGKISAITPKVEEKVEEKVEDKIAQLENELATLKAEKEQAENAKNEAEAAKVKAEGAHAEKLKSLENELNEIKNIVVTKDNKRDEPTPVELPKWKADMVNRKKYELS